MEVEGSKFDDNVIQDESKHFKYERLNDETKQENIRPSMKESALLNHFSNSRVTDEKICLEWKNINYSTLVKGILSI